MQIPIHSLVDLITNSSTVIYTEASGKAIKMAKEIINLVLKEAGADKTADDLFDFKVVHRPLDLFDWAYWQVDPEIDALPNLQALRIARDLKEYKVRVGAIRKYLQDNEAALEEYFDSGLVCKNADGFGDKLIITTKEGIDTQFADKALSMFYSFAEHEG